jgi:hypothetical protein
MNIIFEVFYKYEHLVSLGAWLVGWLVGRLVSRLLCLLVHSLFGGALPAAEVLLDLKMIGS